VRVEVPAQAPTLDADAVASFRALETAICLDCPSTGVLWLVPEYTALARPELSAVDFARLLAAARCFPGARIARFTSLHLDTPTTARHSAGPPASPAPRSE
jgi:hypothetical protein